MSKRLPLDQHILSGSHVGRALRREAQDGGLEAGYGVPEMPAGLDEAEQKAWDALVTEHGPRLWLTDGSRLLQLTRAAVLLDQAYRAAKKGAMRAGRRNPAFVQIAQMTKVQQQLLAPILARRPSRAHGTQQMLRRLDDLIDGKAN